MPRAEAGFTLVEVLVAMVVSGLLLAVVFQATGSSLARLRRTADRREADLDGHYLLARAHAGDRLPASGRAGHFTWSATSVVAVADPRGLASLSRTDLVLRDRAGTVLFSGSTMRMAAAR